MSKIVKFSLHETNEICKRHKDPTVEFVNVAAFICIILVVQGQQVPALDYFQHIGVGLDETGPRDTTS